MRGAPGAFLGGHRPVAIDGTCLDVADTEENAGFFGRPGVMKGEQAAFPRARVVAVAECATHAIFDAVAGSYTTAENTLTGDLVDRLAPGMVVLADREVCGFPLWSRAQATGADLLWRATSVMKPRILETLADGSSLAELRPSGNEPVGQRKAQCRASLHPDRRTPDRRRAAQRRNLPALYHHPRPRRRVGRRPGGRLHAAMGDRERLRRAQGPPARSAQRAALEVARARPPRNLGPPLLPLRHPHPDVGGRRPGWGRPRPGQLHRRPAHRLSLDLPGARSFLLRALSPDGDTPSPSSYGASTRPGVPDPTPGSSIKWHVKRAHHRSWPQPTRPPRITILGAPSP